MSSKKVLFKQMGRVKVKTSSEGSVEGRDKVGREAREVFYRMETKLLANVKSMGMCRGCDKAGLMKGSGGFRFRRNQG